MATLLAIIAIGFLLGMRHATDPDHVIAVSTIVSHEGKPGRAALVGAAWGVGHTVTILLVGSAIIIFRIALPPRVGLAMELAVGVMLVILGLRNLGGLFAWSAERVSEAPVRAPHYHAHGDFVHSHGDGRAHDPQHNPVAAMDRWLGGFTPYQLVRPLVIGIVHGLAGSAAVALLVLSAISNPRWAVAYLAVFGVGTVLGMMMITVAIGSTYALFEKRFESVGRQFGLVAGIISVVFGLVIAYQTGIVNGLFTANANWIPR